MTGGTPQRGRGAFLPCPAVAGGCKSNFIKREKRKKAASRKGRGVKREEKKIPRALTPFCLFQFFLTFVLKFPIFCSKKFSTKISGSS